MLRLSQCVPERLALKQEVIAQLDSLAPDDTIVASNSSSYSCSEIVAGLALKHKRRVMSAHTCKVISTDVLSDPLINDFCRLAPGNHW
jgi:hypothetical protein